ncbi:MAG: Stk1 family PASTA domain-containing Ser/Thr kinase [Actinobacteria bacterium]|nr:Stk1 family PASTA domain-containing Ser/Thr kinase [Actinomycetota bacterium]
MSHDTSGESADLASSPLDGRYRILSRLGSGGMADVYLARDESLGRLVAVKVLKERLAADAEFVERFRIEAQAAASLNHPAIVAVYDRGKAGASPYIAMEYVDGESLKQRLRRKGRLSPDEAAATALAVLAALNEAHARHIVHRDVTSSNVLVDGTGRVKVADFGIARMGASALTRTGAMLGTSSYLSPEQAQGRSADTRSDLYSLGVVLFEILTGQLPFSGESDLAVAMQHVSAAPPNPRSLSSDVPEAYAAVVMTALSKQPADRYQSADEFAAALRSARDGGHAAPAAVLRVEAGPPVPAAVPRPPSAAPAPAATVVAADALTRPADGATRYMSEVRQAPAARPRGRRLWRWVALAAIIAAAAAGAWAVYALVLAPGTKVPGLTGRARDEAVAVLKKDGLKPVVHEVWADRFDAGIVARQRPRAGVKVDDGSKVDLWVSRGPLHIPAPDLAGKRSVAATTLLEGESLTARKRKAATRNVPKGEIYRQEPAAGATVKRGDTVTFWVSSGPPVVTVPDVVGRSSGDAGAALEAEGFVVSIDYVAGWGEFPGDVVEQDPVAGTRLRKGDEVVIKVAVF